MGSSSVNGMMLWENEGKEAINGEIFFLLFTAFGFSSVLKSSGTVVMKRKIVYWGYGL